jgi:poly(3-hydroxybutyrate) depolymerase
VRGRALAVIVATMTVGAVWAAPASAAVALRGRVVTESFASVAGTLFYDVYVPPGYDGSTVHYPVIYYLHGLPAGPQAFMSFGYVPEALEAAGLPSTSTKDLVRTGTPPSPCSFRS